MSWHVHINHTWREGNKSADWLANFSLSLDTFDLHMIETPPKELQCLLFYEIYGACMPQNVRLIALFSFSWAEPSFLYQKKKKKMIHLKIMIKAIA